VTVQTPVALVIVNVAPTCEQAPDEVYVTAFPELAVAATVNCDPFAALAGACVVTVIV
jgi:hypothetical protein